MKAKTKKTITEIMTDLFNRGHRDPVAYRKTACYRKTLNKMMQLPYQELTDLYDEAKRIEAL